MKLFRVKTTGATPQSGYGEVADNWEPTETQNEFRVQVIDFVGFDTLAGDDPAIIEYWEA